MTIPIQISNRELLSDCIRARLVALRQVEQALVDLQRALDKGEDINLDALHELERPVSSIAVTPAAPSPKLEKPAPETPGRGDKPKRKDGPGRPRKFKGEAEPGPRRYKNIARCGNCWRAQGGVNGRRKFNQGRLTQLEAAQDAAEVKGCSVEDLLLPEFQESQKAAAPKAARSMCINTHKRKPARGKGLRLATRSPKELARLYAQDQDAKIAEGSPPLERDVEDEE